MATIDGLFDGAREGQSAALVIRGEAGIGKTALLDYAASRADGLRVLRGAGIETESELPYAGLSLLLGRTAERVDALSERQARELRAALGHGPEASGDTFAIGLAVLTLLAEEGPVLCLIDDAHWLDQASADVLLFAARRLEAEGVVLVFAARRPQAPEFPAAGLDELHLGGLTREAAEDLMGDLPAHAREEVLTEARGNPLALQVLSARKRGPGTPPAGSASPQSRILESFAAHVAELPEMTRTLLLVAAIDDTGDPGVVVPAAKTLGADLPDLDPAERAGLVWQESGRLTFGHPLIRTAVSQSAPSSRRAVAHRALAGVLDADRSAWHLAAAATGPDEEAAAALESTAERARYRGGHAAICAAYERAAVLSPGLGDRDRRWLAAARAAASAGQFERASALAGQIRHPPGGEMAKLRAVIADGLGHTEEAHTVLFENATDLRPDEVDPVLRSAVRAAWRANDFVAIEKIADCAEEGSAVHRLATAALATNKLDEGGIEILKDLLVRDEPSADLQDRLLFARLHLIIGDIEGAHHHARRLERECRAAGAFGVLPDVQVILAHTQILLGHYPDARATIADGLRISEDTGRRMPRIELSTILAELTAITGDEERCRELVAEALERDLAPASVHGHTALSLLDLGLGRNAAALERLEPVMAGARPMGLVGNLPILVESAARLGRPERGAEAARLFIEWAAKVDRPWADATALRCRALLGDDLDLFAQSVRLPQSPFERARTELLYGERLRRDRHMAEARTHLRSAAEEFDRVGATPWAERARGELRATGESRGTRDLAPDLTDRLTPQELQVVRLAVRGMSNRDIGAQLFLSPRTVGYHLYKVFPKLGVASRSELAGLGL